jgi:chemotaxis protein MotB
MSALAGFMLASSGCAELDELRAENEQLRKVNANWKSSYTALEAEKNKLTEENSVLNGRIEAVARESKDITSKKDEEIEALRAKLGKSPGVELLNTPEGIVIRLSNKVFFDLGKETLNQKSCSTLDKVGKILEAEFKGQAFRVMGHTDKVPMRATSKFKSNWELSCMRACSVVRYLIDKKFIDAEQITAAGHAFYEPAVPWKGRTNVPENRRVEILVVPKPPKVPEPAPSDKPPVEEEEEAPLEVTPK